MELQISSSTIIPLESIHQQQQQQALIGGKASGLSRLIGMGLPVPEGFCISTAAYMEHFERCGATIPAGTADQGERASRLSAIRKAILEKPISDALLTSLKAQYERLNAPCVAVRSSATEEDQAGQSCAGLYETHLGIRSFDECVDAVKKCWASLWTERVVLYGEKRGINQLSASMAVIVQRLITADSSGVIFTGDFLGGKEERIVVEACHGLGEALVSGKVTPDRFIIRKRDLHLLEKSIASKSLRIDADRSGSVIERLLSARESRSPSIDGHTIRKLCRLALKAESATGEGQDIEWALMKGTIYFLQCRPITARLRFDINEPPHIWSSVNAGEVLQDVVTPLSYSLISTFIDCIFIRNLRNIGIDFGQLDLLGLIDGRVYFDITAISEIMHHLPAFMRADLNTMFGGHQEKLLGTMLKGFPRGFSRPKINFFRLLFELPHFLSKVAMNTARDTDTLVKELRGITREMKSVNITSLSEPQLMEFVNVFSQKMRAKIPNALVPILGGLSGYQCLSSMCKRWFNDRDSSRVHKLLMSTGKVDSADPGLALMEIASLINNSPDLERLVQTEQPFTSLREKALQFPRGEKFLQLWDRFMECHGHHTRSELELYNQRWAESPEYVLSLVKDYMTNLAHTDPLEEYKKRAEERKALVRECHNHLKNPLKRIVFDYTMSKTLCGLALRELYKSEAMRHLSIFRSVFLELGRRFTSRNFIDQRDDIFFLTLDEVESLCKGAPMFNARDTVEARHREYKKNLTVTHYPIVVGTRDEKRFIPYIPDNTIELLTGVAVSNGTARGPARVFTSKDEFDHILPGEILVIPCSDPGWSPYFIASAGIVMDMGGIFSHGCIIAREYGIPTVVNVGPATRIIRTGQLVEIDGNTGTVRIIR